MPLETWVSIGTLLGVGLSLAGLMFATTRSLRTELKGDISESRTDLKGDLSELRTEVKGDIAELRTEVKGDIAELRTVVDRLDERVYALATGQAPRPLIVPRSRD